MKIKNYNHPLGQCREFYYCGNPVEELGGDYACAHLIPKADDHWLVILEGWTWVGKPAKLKLAGYHLIECDTYRNAKRAIGARKSVGGCWEREALMHGTTQLA